MVPQIQKPRPRKLAEPVETAALTESRTEKSATSSPVKNPAGSAIAATSGPLGLSMTSSRVSLSMMAVTLDYELTLVNSGKEVLRGLVIEGDMIGAHASLPSDQQIAYAERPLEKRHDLAELGPGEHHTIKGQIRLPFAAIRTIAQGRSPLLVPLSRWRVLTSEPQLAPLVQTFLIGQPSDRRQQGIQPFRLDQGPRVFSQIVQRSFA